MWIYTHVCKYTWFFVLWKPWKAETSRVTGMQGRREINNMDLEIYIETDEILTFTNLWNNWCHLVCTGHSGSTDLEISSENAIIAIESVRFDLFLVNPCWPVPTHLFFSFLGMTWMRLQCKVILLVSVCKAYLAISYLISEIWSFHKHLLS